MCGGDSISLRMAMSCCLSVDSVEILRHLVCLMCNKLGKTLLIVTAEASKFFFFFLKRTILYYVHIAVYKSCHLTSI